MSVTLIFNDEQNKIPMSERIKTLFEELAKTVAVIENLSRGEVEVTIIDDEAMQELNKQYRDVDRTTDVLSFPMEDQGFEDAPEIPLLLGDIMISSEKALLQSKAYNHSFERELGFLFVHGFLHLLGYDHEDEAGEKEMTEKQELILSRIGLTR